MSASMRLNTRIHLFGPMDGVGGMNAFAIISPYMVDQPSEFKAGVISAGARDDKDEGWPAPAP